MLFFLDLQDTFFSYHFIKTSNKKFSWSNGLLGDTRREARLDRSHINQILSMKGGTVDF